MHSHKTDDTKYAIYFRPSLSSAEVVKSFPWLELLSPRFCQKKAFNMNDDDNIFVVNKSCQQTKH